jgi:hypothetical protein
MVQLTDELLDLLDSEAARRGLSRSALIRSIVSDYLSESAQAAVTRQIVDGYLRIPPTTPDEWGEVEIQDDHATKELLQRLDAEERAAGTQW